MSYGLNIVKICDQYLVVVRIFGISKQCSTFVPFSHNSVVISEVVIAIPGFNISLSQFIVIDKL